MFNHARYMIELPHYQVFKEQLLRDTLKKKRNDLSKLSKSKYQFTNSQYIT